MATQTEKNTAYGMKLRLSGMRLRGEGQEKINALNEKYQTLMKKIEREEK